MKKIVNGRRYDTETAKCVASDSYGQASDLNSWSEWLYRKNSGEFFLFGEGGPMSKYAVSRGENQWSGGSAIIPLSPESARKWAEEHLDGEEYESIFGEIKSGGKRTVTFSLSESTIETISRLAAEKGIPKSEIVQMAITNFSNT